MAWSCNRSNCFSRFSTTRTGCNVNELSGRCVRKVSFFYQSTLGQKTSKFEFCYRKKTFFVDLFVRVSNKVAINMYTNLGYIVYRTVLEYYSGDPDEDAFGEFFRFIVA